MRSQLIELDRSSAASSSSSARVGGREKTTKRSLKGYSARKSENADEVKTDSVFGASIRSLLSSFPPGSGANYDSSADEAEARALDEEIDQLANKLRLEAQERTKRILSEAMEASLPPGPRPLQ